ncbi:hypothetical protein AMS68_007393 [Peltaster fructicola]|uniref:Coiled-coil domain-containing protein 16 n=1 Tax=Peltaster fructicola TaxID=286661 RepID=A0A6H0Y4I9_9PEZI|nr:hypothetical protein AMS68_007393 [Peltaster fructicola]
MADVRSMLRAERESRRITHPHASYTSAGNLLCNICEVPIKSERAWNAHLHTTQHSLRLGRERDAAQARSSQPSGKKRKAVEFEEPEIDRKKVKPTAQESPEHNSVLDTAPAGDVPAVAEVESSILPDDIDDEAAAAELAALDRSLAALEAEHLQSDGSALAALSAPATIVAPAVSAQELAAQAREEQSKQRSRRDEEVENEREDAVRALEDEFEEMDSLQERLKKLRERREALRERAAVDAVNTGQVERGSTGIPDRSVHTGKATEDDESDDSDSADDWNFGAR